MKTTRILTLIASALLGSAFLFPLWKISLWAPQYPEGLSMQIWISKLTGDLQTINTLNHYIGMSHIDASSFPELQIFPYVFGGLAIFGLIVFLLNKRILLYSWTLALVIFSGVALYDFWAWEYKFGHELNPDAAIKMEDMVYQPPLIGEKVFLNIVASSYPDLAGIGMITAVTLALVATGLCIKKPKEA